MFNVFHLLSSIPVSFSTPIKSLYDKALDLLNLLYGISKATLPLLLNFVSFYYSFSYWFSCAIMVR